ncbi:hypothetical protein LIER_06910 [Lithospermum erythrorhizon]|uniref:Polygalacturonase n=1 Tax=Lithospermum erythrorhizon TaxID=34254 RepID=A0AAV3P7H6_LITER
MTKLLMSLSLFLLSTFINKSKADTAYNVVQFDAKPDGKTDCTKQFLKTWAATCNSVKAATMFVPKGKYLLKNVVFRGPCKNKVNVRIEGSLIAPSDYRALGSSGYWILFNHINKLAVSGGTLDARGASFWECRASGKSCPVGARSITFNYVNDAVISGLTSINSQLMHIVINSCNNVMVRNVNVVAPDWSPNTDGIHVQGSTGVTISGSSMKTGDDCISIGPGTKNLWMEKIKCGPGHGVSIGSLARDFNEEGVQNVTLINSVFSGSDNGLRIKSWARPSTGFVSNINYKNIVMNNVENPIIIDQNYCPNNQGCPGQTSGTKISQVVYQNVQGTSATRRAMIFDCSPSNPCKGIRLHDIKLTYLNQKAQSYCKNIGGITTGVIMPENCL